MRWAATVLVGCLVLCSAPRTGSAGEGGPGPGKPIWPRRGQTDAMLAAKAERINAQMWSHLTPEGLLVVIHKRDASPAQLSSDALHEADCAIWTGCYAAAQACRWRDTRAPDALKQVRHLAKGLEALGTVTGRKGTLVRSVGVPLPKQRPPNAHRAPSSKKLWFVSDVSRDQLAGVVFGWAFIGRYMKDPELKRMAAANSAAIARRLWNDRLWMRDHKGAKTEFGELRRDVSWVPFVKNGGFAAIGLATFVVAADLNPKAQDLQRMLGALVADGWVDALPNQNTFSSAIVTASNVNMFSLSLLCLTLAGRPTISHKARLGMKSLRKATVGWWNAGICACFLHAGHAGNTRRLLGEIRATLHAIPEKELPRKLVHCYETNAISPIWQREPSAWHWTNNPRKHYIWRSGGRLDDRLMRTGADWLFAYWIARASGRLRGPATR